MTAVYRARLNQPLIGQAVKLMRRKCTEGIARQSFYCQNRRFKAESVLRDGAVFTQIARRFCSGKLDSGRLIIAQYA
jgi:hypothetical protein